MQVPRCARCATTASHWLLCATPSPLAPTPPAVQLLVRRCLCAAKAGGCTHASRVAWGAGMAAAAPAELLAADFAPSTLLPLLDAPCLAAAAGVNGAWARGVAGSGAWRALVAAEAPQWLPLLHASPLPARQRDAHPTVAVARAALRGAAGAPAGQLASWLATLSAAPPTLAAGGLVDARAALLIHHARAMVQARFAAGMAAKHGRGGGGVSREQCQLPHMLGAAKPASPPPGTPVLAQFMTPRAVRLRWWLDLAQHSVMLLVPPGGLALFFLALGLRMDGVLPLPYAACFALLIAVAVVVVLVGVLAIASRVLTERARLALHGAGLLSSGAPGATALPAHAPAAAVALHPAELAWHAAWLPQGEVERRFTLWGMGMWWLVAAVQRKRQYTVWLLAAGTVTVFLAAPLVIALKAAGGEGVALGWRLAMAPALFVLLAALCWPNVIGSTWGRTSWLLRLTYNLVCCPLALPLTMTLALWALRLDGAGISLEMVFLPVWLAAGLITLTVLCGGATALASTSTAPPPPRPRTGAGPGAAPPPARTGPLQRRFDEAWQALVVYASVAAALLCGLLLAALLLLYRKVALDEAAAAAAVARDVPPHADRSAFWWSSWSLAIAPTWALALAILAGACVIRSRVLAFQGEWLDTHKQRWAERVAATAPLPA